jgi:Saxitoxin biosynthesis operon protein SxtJ
MIVGLNLHPSRRQLRQFGLAALAAFTVLGTAALRNDGSGGRLTAYVLLGLGVVSGILALFWPKANKPLFVIISVLAFPIGFVVSHVLLSLIFFGVLTPTAMLLRWIGRDALERKWDKERASYWSDLPRAIDKKQYFRQF